MLKRYLGQLGEDRYQAPIDFGVLTGSYSNLDVLTSGNLYADVGRVGQTSGIIESIYVKLTNCTPVGSLYIFGGPIDPPAQNDPRDFTDSQMAKFVGIVPFNFAAYTLGPIDIIYRTLDIPFVTQVDSKGLYFVFVQSQPDGFSSSARVKGYFTIKRD